jgi:antitoxin YefM
LTPSRVLGKMYAIAHVGFRADLSSRRSEHRHGEPHMRTLTATQARRELFDLVKGAADREERFRIQHPRGCAILLSEDEYEGLTETLELLSIPGFRERLERSLRQVENGDTLSMDEVLGDLG